MQGQKLGFNRLQLSSKDGSTFTLTEPEPRTAQAGPSGDEERKGESEGSEKEKNEELSHSSEDCVGSMLYMSQLKVRCLLLVTHNKLHSHRLCLIRCTGPMASRQQQTFRRSWPGQQKYEKATSRWISSLD